MADERYEGLADEWRHWIVAALAGGRTPIQVVRALADQGVPMQLATHEVDVIATCTPAMGRLVRRYRMVLDVLTGLAAEEITRRDLCGAQEFYEHHFTTLRPALFRDGCAAMAARRWTFDDLRARFGHVEVEVGAPRPVTLRLADALQRMEQPDAPPELYIVAHNRVLEGPLQPLTEELSPLPEFIDGDRARRTANLWLGPRGAVSPLHHDTTHVYVSQLFGTKAFALVAPWEAELLGGPIDGTDSGFDLDHPGDVRVHRIVLEPGESLFIPVGWWHRAQSLQPSISVSLRAFRWPGGFEWYLPGSPGASIVDP